MTKVTKLPDQCCAYCGDLRPASALRTIYHCGPACTTTICRDRKACSARIALDAEQPIRPLVVDTPTKLAESGTWKHRHLARCAYCGDLRPVTNLLESFAGDYLCKTEDVEACVARHKALRPDHAVVESPDSVRCRLLAAGVDPRLASALGESAAAANDLLAVGASSKNATRPGGWAFSPGAPYVVFGDKSMIFPKNLGWLHRNLRHVERFDLSPCTCTDCIVRPDTHAFALRAHGRIPRGRAGKLQSFEYVTSYASRGVFETCERARLENWAPVVDHTVDRASIDADPHAKHATESKVVLSVFALCALLAGIVGMAAH